MDKSKMSINMEWLKEKHGILHSSLKIMYVYTHTHTRSTRHIVEWKVNTLKCVIPSLRPRMPQPVEPGCWAGGWAWG